MSADMDGAAGVASCSRFGVAAGSAFHFGMRISPASNDIDPSSANTPLQPQRWLKKPGSVPPTIAPTDPKPLIMPDAVEAPFFVPKSTAATPTIRLSGANSNK